MIFKSKREFENMVNERIYEIDFRSKTEEKLYRLEEELNNLKHHINRLEDRLTAPAPTPYIVTPTWTGADLVDHAPNTAWGGGSTTVKEGE